MLHETVVQVLSQFVYLKVPALCMINTPTTIGEIADYYQFDPVGQAYMHARFGNIPAEYTRWKAFLRNGIDDVRNFTVCNIWNDNQKKHSGFFACSYLSPDNEMVTAFRGSEMLGNVHYKNDYKTNVALSYTTQTPQQKMVEEYLDLYHAFYLRPYTLTGHSLGGNLALHAAVRSPAPHCLHRCYAFNAPGMNAEYQKKYMVQIETVQSKLYLMQNREDIISSLLYPIAKPIVLASQAAPLFASKHFIKEIFYPHSNFMFVKEQNHFVRDKTEKKTRLCRTASVLTRLFVKLPIPVRKVIAHRLLDIFYSKQSPEQQRIFFLECITGYMVQNGVNIEKAGILLNELMASAKQNATAGHTPTDYPAIKTIPYGEDPVNTTTYLLLQLIQHSYAANGNRPIMVDEVCQKCAHFFNQEDL